MTGDNDGDNDRDKEKDRDDVVLSVRGEAQRTVAPDQAALSCAVSVLADSKDAARAGAIAALEQLTEALAELGGQPLTPEAARVPLTWSAYSVQTHRDHGNHGPTGRHWAMVQLRIMVRDFVLVPRVEALLGRAEHAEVGFVNWSVDDDNAAWAQVRADAIHAALAKGRDYAAALGGSVTAVQQIADGGLLDGTPSYEHGARLARMSGNGDADGLALDPVPQTVGAVIEARLSASIPAGAIP
jgi:uncharacterized protein YggE